MGIPVKLNVFEGPLDLLLHLIDKHKLNIYDIEIAKITDQYLKYIDLMEVNKLEVMSEFIEMAATLISIKAKMLLPIDENETDEEKDPRQELLEKLIEYKKFKLISQQLKDRQLEADKVFFKEASIPDEIKNYTKDIDPIKILEGVDFSILYQVFQSIMKKKANKVDLIRSKFGEITRETFSVDDKIIYIKKMCESYTSFSFRDMLNEQSSKVEVIVTFLAILELMKIGEIEIVQDSVFDEIMIKYIDLKL